MGEVAQRLDITVSAGEQTYTLQGLKDLINAGVRNKIVSPRCTEGTHFCGVPVWNTFPNVERRL